MSASSLTAAERARERYDEQPFGLDELKALDGRLGEAIASGSTFLVDSVLEEPARRVRLLLGAGGDDRWRAREVLDLRRRLSRLRSICLNRRDDLGHYAAGYLTALVERLETEDMRLRLQFESARKREETEQLKAEVAERLGADELDWEQVVDRFDAGGDVDRSVTVHRALKELAAEGTVVIHHDGDRRRWRLAGR